MRLPVIVPLPNRSPPCRTYSGATTVPSRFVVPANCSGLTPLNLTVPDLIFRVPRSQNFSSSSATGFAASTSMVPR